MFVVIVGSFDGITGMWVFCFDIWLQSFFRRYQYVSGYCQVVQRDQGLRLHFQCDGFKTLQEGQKVVYDVEPDPKNSSKMRAVNVRVA